MHTIQQFRRHIESLRRLRGKEFARSYWQHGRCATPYMPLCEVAHHPLDQFISNLTVQETRAPDLLSPIIQVGCYECSSLGSRQLETPMVRR
jgi:hypothetical protein